MSFDPIQHRPDDERVLPPADVVACGAHPKAPLCGGCIEAYRNGIEPRETACDEDAREVRAHIQDTSEEDTPA